MPDTEPEPTVATAWDQGAGKPFIVLAVARAAMQAAGLGWFVISARLLSPAEFGRLATGLIFFAVFAGLGDLGTTRTVTRHVASHPDAAAAIYRRGALLRTGAGLSSTAVVTGIIAVVPTQLSLPIVVLAGLTATASGLSEIAYAALRGIGRIRTESVLLVGERAAFLGLAVGALLAGGGATAVMALYLGTNLASAVLSATVAARAGDFRHATAPDHVAFLDREGRATAAEFVLVTVSPRVSPLVLALLAAPTAVASFAAAQRPVEALALLAVSTAAPVLPIVRRRLVLGRDQAATDAAVTVSSAIALAFTPIAVWLLVRPEHVLQLLFGGARYAGSATALRLLALTALTWSIRGVVEFTMLAHDRAVAFLRIVTIGITVNIAAAIALVPTVGVTGAASATLVAEIVMTVLAVVALPGLVDRNARRRWLPVPLLGAACGAALAMLPELAVGVGVVAAASCVTAVIAARAIIRLDAGAVVAP